MEDAAEGQEAPRLKWAGVIGPFQDNEYVLRAEAEAKLDEARESRLHALQKIMEVGTERDRALDALERYGQHDADCEWGKSGVPGTSRCTCGYRDALAEHGRGG